MERVITIAGGGLAGLSLGIALRERNIPVVLHESGGYPRHRVCGEFISGVTQKTLTNLGIHDLFNAARFQKTCAWYASDHLVLEKNLPVPALGISRHLLDESLRRRFESLGGTLQTESRLACIPTEGLVWCTGRRVAKSDWIGLKCHLEGYPLDHDLEMHLGSGGYVGLARVEQGLINVCGLFRVRKEIRSDDLLSAYLRAAGLSNLADELGSAAMAPQSFSAVAGFQIGWQRTPPGLFALGDSLAMIPPFTGNGMSMAFESAETALEPLTQYANGRLSWENMRWKVHGRLRRRFGARLFLAQLFHPFLTSRRGQSFFANASRAGLLPFRTCFQLLR